jgi:hypothetical protein
VYFTDTIILVTILRYFVLKKYDAVMSSMEYFMFVDEVTSFSYYPVLIILEFIQVKLPPI